MKLFKNPQRIASKNRQIPFHCFQNSKWTFVYGLNSKCFIIRVAIAMNLFHLWRKLHQVVIKVDFSVGSPLLKSTKRSLKKTWKMTQSDWLNLLEVLSFNFDSIIWFNWISIYPYYDYYLSLFVTYLLLLSLLLFIIYCYDCHFIFQRYL